jgi:hypothetical protein
VRAVDHDLVSADFPTGKIPDKSKESVGEYSSGFGICETRSCGFQDSRSCEVRFPDLE